MKNYYQLLLTARLLKYDILFENWYDNNQPHKASDLWIFQYSSTLPSLIAYLLQMVAQQMKILLEIWKHFSYFSVLWRHIVIFVALQYVTNFNIAATCLWMNPFPDLLNLFSLQFYLHSHLLLFCKLILTDFLVICLPAQPCYKNDKLLSYFSFIK